MKSLQAWIGRAWIICWFASLVPVWAARWWFPDILEHVDGEPVQVDGAAAWYCRRCGAESGYFGPVDYEIKDGLLKERP